MAKNTKYHKVDGEKNIYWYETKKGKRFYVRINYKKQNGERAEKTESSLINITAARRKRTELQRIIDEGNTSMFDADKTPFKSWRERYFRIKSRRWKKTTVADVESIYRNYLRQFDHLPLSKVNIKSDYEDFITHLLFEKDLSKEYVRKIHAKMMNIINFAVEDEKLGYNRLRSVEIEKIEPPKKKKLEKDEILFLDKWAKANLCTIKYMNYLLMRFGWRRGESLGPKKGSIKIISKSPLIVDLKMDNAKSGYEEETTPKTLKSYRTNRFTGDHAQAILDAVEEAEKIYKTHGKEFNNESRIIVNKNSCRTYSVSLPGNILKKVADSIGHTTPHMLRHSFATHSLKSGNDPATVADWLGHSPKMTQEVYNHVTKESHLKLVAFANKENPPQNPPQKLVEMA